LSEAARVWLRKKARARRPWHRFGDNKRTSIAFTCVLISLHRGFPAEIFVYKRNGAPLFQERFRPLVSVPVSHNSSRKQFFGKLVGVVAASAVLPKLAAKSVTAPIAATATPSNSVPAFTIRRDARVVVRRDTA
jgi:hypothetical protein